MIRHISTPLTAAALLLAVAATPAHAQEVRVSITYNLSVNATSDEAADITAAQGKARRAMYTMMAKECEVLTETIAESCALKTFNIRSGNQRRRRNDTTNAVTVTGNGTYRIRLK